MKHTLTFYTDDSKISSIHDIDVTFLDQDGNPWRVNAKSTKMVKHITSVNDIVNNRIKELNDDRILELAAQDRAISREELGISPAQDDSGFKILPEGLL